MCLDTFICKSNIRLLPLVLFCRSKDNVNVDDELGGTKCWQRPCVCYTRARPVPLKSRTQCIAAHTFSFLLYAASCLEAALSSILNPAHTACSDVYCFQERSSQEVPLRAFIQSMQDDFTRFLSNVYGSALPPAFVVQFCETVGHHLMICVVAGQQCFPSTRRCFCVVTVQGPSAC